MKNSAGRGGCYPPRPKAKMDNTLRDLQDSSYPTKAEFSNCFINYSFKIREKMSFIFKNFVPSNNIYRPQVFSVNGSIIWSGLRF